MSCVYSMAFLCGSTLVRVSLLQAATVAIWPQMFKSDIKPKQTKSIQLLFFDGVYDKIPVSSLSFWFGEIRARYTKLTCSNLICKDNTWTIHFILTTNEVCCRKSGVCVHTSPGILLLFVAVTIPCLLQVLDTVKFLPTLYSVLLHWCEEN